MTDHSDRRAELLAQLVELRPDIREFLASLCRRRGQVIETVDDELQDVMTAAIENLPTYREEGGTFKGWTLGIAANVARRAERSQRRGEVLLDAPNAIDDAAIEPRPSPERAAQLNEVRAKVVSTLAKMPASLLQVLLAVSIEEGSHEAAAAQLQISPAASKKRLERARRYLEKESGVRREDVRAAVPFLFLGEAEQRRRLGAVWQAVAVSSPIVLVCFLLPSATRMQPAHTAGLSLRFPRFLVTEPSAPAPSPAPVIPANCVNPVPAPQRAAKPSLDPRAPQRPAKPVAPPASTTGSFNRDIDSLVRRPVP